jgi:hypothetical protein
MWRAQGDPFLDFFLSLGNSSKKRRAERRKRKKKKIREMCERKRNNTKGVLFNFSAFMAIHGCLYLIGVDKWSK